MVRGKKNGNKGIFRNILQSMRKELGNVIGSRAKLLKRREEIIRGMKVSEEEEKKMQMKILQLSDIRKSLNKNLLSVDKKIGFLDRNIKKIHVAEKDLKEDNKPYQKKI